MAREWLQLALVVASLLCATVLVAAQDTTNKPPRVLSDGPRVLTKNRNDIQKIEEKQDIQEDEWQLDDLKAAKEATAKTNKEEEVKRNQDDTNQQRFAIQAEKMKELTDREFQRELERTKEQGKKTADEQEAKSKDVLQFEDKEDARRFKVRLQSIKREEQLNERKLQFEKQKLDFIHEHGEKHAHEQKQKMEMEQTMKSDAEKRRAKVDKEKARQEKFLRQQQEQRAKQEEQTAKSDKQRIEHAKALIRQKDENNQKHIARQNENLEKEKQRYEEQKAKVIAEEQAKKRQAQEQKAKRCVPLTVWSGGFPRNIWQFRVKSTTYNRQNAGYRRGFNVLVLSPKKYSIVSLRSYDTFASSRESRQMAADLKRVPKGSVIAIACMDECSRSREKNLVNALKSLGFRSAHRIGFRHSYVGIVTKGKGGVKEVYRGNSNVISASARYNCN